MRTQYLQCTVVSVNRLMLGVLVLTPVVMNSLLPRFNARRQLRAKMEESEEVSLPTNVLFGEPQAASQNMLLIHSNNPFSPSETQFSSSPRGMH